MLPGIAGGAWPAPLACRSRQRPHSTETDDPSALALD